METKYNILIVDDNPINIKVLMDSLAKPEYKLLSATSGQKALMIAEKVKPNLVLLDINMPGLNGYDTCKALKENEITKDIPVIFLSALNEVGNKVHGFNVGGVDYITKPFQREEVLVRVETQIKISELHRKTVAQKEEIYSLLHILTHDILNQIMLIDISSTLVETEQNLDDNGKLRISTIQQTVRNISTLISKIKSITRIDEGKYQFDKVNIGAKEIEKEIETVFEHRMKEKNLEFEFDINSDCDEKFICVDPVIFLNTIVDNLISNSIKFSFENSKILLKAEKDEKESRLIVRDYGTGMTSKHLEKIFKTNVNTTMTGTKGERGTGYGMPLVKRYTEALGGSIKVESTFKEDGVEDHGTTMILSFPWSE
jgi:signal transduction histidine kinase